MNNEYLAHHGIKGMQWGVRRSGSQIVSSHKIKKPAGVKIDGYKKHKLPKGVIVKSENPAKKMSDAELRQKINRLQMEQQYSKLTGTDVNRGKQVASKTFKAGTTIAAVTTTGLTIYNNAQKIKDIIEKVK